jgi:diacylglycerol kinase family enzyme
MQLHYAVIQAGISIYEFHADDDEQAVEIAKNRYTDYDLLICISSDGVRKIGG